MINKIQLSHTTPKLKTLALASTIALAATLQSCTNLSSKNNLAELKRDSIELTNKNNSLESGMSVTNNQNYRQNDTTSNSSTAKQKKDSDTNKESRNKMRLPLFIAIAAFGLSELFKPED